jgi:hypothetical protein
MSKAYSESGSELIEESLRLIDEGKMDTEISQILGIPPRLLREIRDRHGRKRSGGKKSEISTEVIEESLALIDSGLSDREIEKILGISTHKLREIRDKHGRERSKGKRTNYTIEQRNDVIDLIREGNTMAEISRQTGVSSSKIKQWREDEVRNGNPLPNFMISRPYAGLGSAVRQKYSDEEILDLIFLNRGYGSTDFVNFLGITSSLFLDICGTWKEITNQDLFQHLNEVDHFTLDEYRRLYDTAPSSYPVIRKIVKEDGSINEIPVFPPPHKKEFSWGDVVPNNENNPTIDWITNRVKLQGHMSSESDRNEFVQQTGAGKSKFNKWMKRAGLIFDKESGLWFSERGS